MKFDTIIIGCGLAGLTGGIRLAEQGHRVAIISRGGSSLLFNTGSLGLLGFGADGAQLAAWADGLAALPPEHPYARVGISRVPDFAAQARDLLSRCGLSFSGSASGDNHQRLSPVGLLRPAWLTMEGLLTHNYLTSALHASVVGLAGFLDFYPRFIAASLRERGVTCDVITVDTPDLRALRASATEMRAANIARALRGDALERLAGEINRHKLPADAVLILPAAVDMNLRDELCRLTGRTVLFAPTLGASVPGMHIAEAMIRRFKSLGGRIFNGHTVVSGTFGGSALKSVATDKLDGDELLADNFILASGSFYGRGLVATPTAVVEPVFGLDVAAPAERADWFADNMFAPQSVMKSGVVADAQFRASRGSVTLENLYVAGSVLAGADSVHEESGAGVAMLTALAVAELLN